MPCFWGGVSGCENTKTNDGLQVILKYGYTKSYWYVLNTRGIALSSRMHSWHLTSTNSKIFLVWVSFLLPQVNNNLCFPPLALRKSKQYQWCSIPRNLHQLIPTLMLPFSYLRNIKSVPLYYNFQIEQWKRNLPCHFLG